MRKVKIFTDSTNDLSSEILVHYDISVVPLYVEFGEENYKDGVNLFPAQLFKLVQEKGVLPKTASPSPYDFISVYRQHIEEDSDILVITLSAKMSSTYQNAILAASEFPAGRIAVVDSQSLTTGIGSLAMIAAELAEQGEGLETIVKTIRSLVPGVKLNFVIDTLEYLYKGGRCNVVQNLLGTALKIRPIIGIEDGRMLVEDKVRGDKRRALDKIVENIIKNREKIDFNRIFVVHSLGGEDEACYIRDAIKQEAPEKDIIETKAGCVISSHCGMNTVGVSYILKTNP